MVIITVDRGVSDKTMETVQNAIEKEQLFNPAYSGTTVKMQRGNGTYIDSNDAGDFNYDDMRLLSIVQNIIYMERFPCVFDGLDIKITDRQ